MHICIGDECEVLKYLCELLLLMMLSQYDGKGRDTSAENKCLISTISDEINENRGNVPHDIEEGLKNGPDQQDTIALSPAMSVDQRDKGDFSKRHGGPKKDDDLPSDQNDKKEDSRYGGEEGVPTPSVDVSSSENLKFVRNLLSRCGNSACSKRHGIRDDSTGELCRLSIRCKDCRGAYYCSRQCREVARAKHVRQECPRIQALCVDQRLKNSKLSIGRNTALCHCCQKDLTHIEAIPCSHCHKVFYCSSNCELENMISHWDECCRKRAHPSSVEKFRVIEAEGKARKGIQAFREKFSRKVRKIESDGNGQVQKDAYISTVPAVPSRKITPVDEYEAVQVLENARLRQQLDDCQEQMDMLHRMVKSLKREMEPQKTPEVTASKAGTKSRRRPAAATRQRDQFPTVRRRDAVRPTTPTHRQRNGKKHRWMTDPDCSSSPRTNLLDKRWMDYPPDRWTDSPGDNTTLREFHSMFKMPKGKKDSDDESCESDDENCYSTERCSDYAVAPKKATSSQSKSASPEDILLASKRLRHDLDECQSGTLYGIAACPRYDDEFTWSAVILGPKNSRWESGRFNLIMEFPKNYPFNPPSVRFAVPILCHPNICPETGEVYLDIFERGFWSPAWCASAILISVQSLLDDVNLEVYVNERAADLYVNNRSKFYAEVQRAVDNSRLDPIPRHLNEMLMA